ncbi:putative plastid-lipid-associated protein [Helianthus annuus]|nr:putative plastid-lipid-associated protein [Helianthus annuus]
MGCSIFTHLPQINTTFVKQRRVRPPFVITFPNHLVRRVVCSAVDEEQIQNTEVLFSDDESLLISSLIGIQGRGRSASPEQLKAVERAVQALEANKGVADPRTFVGVDLFSVFQEIYLRTNDPRVSNIVKFSDAIGELKVEAAATVKDGKRILFRFDKAAFSLKFLPFKVPYPVPFRLLGDEAKGWLDTTYLSKSGNVRISRGNKVTLIRWPFWPVFINGSNWLGFYTFIPNGSNIYNKLAEKEAGQKGWILTTDYAEKRVK